MEMQQLRHFVAVVEHKTMRAASRALSLTQPALTRSIQTLERDLDVPLLRREARRVFPTPAGMAFFQHARLILNECVRAKDEAVQAQSGRLGEVNLGLGGMFATYMVDAAITEISTQFPELRLKVTEGLFENMMEDLQAGLLDVVFSNFPRVKMNADIALDPLIELHHAAFVRTGHRIARKRNLSLGEMVAERWLVIDQPHASLNFENTFEQEDLPIPSHLLRTNSLTLIRSLITRGDFVICMPEEFFDAEIRAGSVKRLNIPAFNYLRRAGLIYRKGTYLPPAVLQVMESIRAVCGRMNRPPI